MPNHLQTICNSQSTLKFLTCGSVDDGKSTLVGRMIYESNALSDDKVKQLNLPSNNFTSTNKRIDFSLVTDGLKAEIEQGITIDISHQYFSTPNRKFIICDFTRS